MGRWLAYKSGLSARRIRLVAGLTEVYPAIDNSRQVMHLLPFLRSQLTGALCIAVDNRRYGKYLAVLYRVCTYCQELLSFLNSRPKTYKNKNKI